MEQTTADRRTSNDAPVAFERFFLPGPTAVRPEVLEAQTGPIIGHRGPEIEELMEELQVGLRTVFQTERPVAVSTSSATGLMEAGIRSGVGRRLLALVNGAFSERFAKIAELCGKPVDRLEIPWGEVHDPDQVRERLAGGDYDTVTVVHSETSTGALNPLSEIAAAVREHDDVFLMVDSVSGAGGAPLKTDEWGLDFALTGTQKALAVPPGLAFGVASERLLQRAEGLPDRGLYLDLVEFYKRLKKRNTPSTPAIPIMYALRAQLERIREEGMEARWSRHREMAERTWAWVDELRDRRSLDVSVLAPQGGRSPTVTCVRLPDDGPDGPAIAGDLRRRGWVIATGYGKLKKETIRIGHMGEQNLERLNALLDVVEEVITQ